MLRALGLGDLLTAVPALRALADAFPDHHRVLATTAAMAPLAQLTGRVNEVISAAPLEPLPPGWSGVEVAVNLHGRGPQSTAVLAALRPKRLIAFGGAPRWRTDEHEVARWCRLLRESGIPADPARLEIPVPGVAIAAADLGATVIHPGAASASRRWPIERWAQVAAGEAASGRCVLVTGSAAERPMAEQLAVAAGLGPAAVRAGQTDVLGLAALVAHAERVLSGDTGVAHLATAYATPSVVLFGPTPPSLWGPPPDRPRHRALWAGRSGNPHAATPDDGLLAIDVAEVVEALADLDQWRRAPRCLPVSRAYLP